MNQILTSRTTRKNNHLESGPSSVGDTVCREMKFSGILRSAGSDSLLLISSWFESFR